ncbi:MAG: hypothetical protein G8345_04180 [Magnetococcales bacterium]|nr:hypothetical protein [Magnetococcales bacterium]NGZ26070.1 hypothetical protein [Magnetococcales bacterium]
MAYALDTFSANSLLSRQRMLSRLKRFASFPITWIGDRAGSGESLRVATYIQLTNTENVRHTCRNKGKREGVENIYNHNIITSSKQDGFHQELMFFFLSMAVKYNFNHISALQQKN